jgi:hypothetical protein
MILHRDERGPAILFRHKLQRRKFKRPHGACGKISDLTAAHQVM